MGCCKIFKIVLLVSSAYIGYQIYQSLFFVPPIPDLPKDQWWGPGNPPKTLDTSIRPFKVQFNPERIAKLKERLSDTTWLTEPLEGIGFQYGFNTKYLKEVIEYWRTKYNFAEREKKLNSFPQFKTNIQGLDIHYVHLTQSNPKKLRVVPLLMLHGWPGSYMEFTQMIFELSSKENEGHDFVFSIVVPSLPGYGYSQGASKTGLGAAQIAVVMANLMERLGYNKYVVQGGDWGSLIGSNMAIFYPEKLIGYHTNMAFANTPLGRLKHLFFSLYPKALVEEKHVSKMYPLGSFYSHIIEESGYMHIQSTKPDTVGVGLKDSPIGLAAYILEKFSTWTNKEWKSLPDGGLTKKYDLSNVLDNIMVYWDSGCITTSMRLYSETMNKAQLALNMDRIPIKVPSGIVRNANELVFSSRCQTEEIYKNIVSFTDFDDVGHFAAFEEPKLMARDLWQAVVEFEKYNKAKNEKKSEL